MALKLFGIFAPQKRLLQQEQEIRKLKQELQALQAQNMGDGVLFKMTDDPRSTRIGKVIRRFSIDEFPQLVNVLRGEMSIVGPSPLAREELELVKSAKRQYLSARPGVAGPRGGLLTPRWAP